MPKDNIGSDFVKTIREQAKEWGVDVKRNLGPVEAYVDEASARLATMTSQPGFSRAVRGEAGIIAMKSVRAAVQSADDLDGRFVAGIFGALSFAVRVIA